MSLQLFWREGIKPQLPPNVEAREDYARLKTDEVSYVGPHRNEDDPESFSCSEVTDFTPDCEPRLVVLPKVVIFGGLSHCDHAENPMESFSEGAIEQGQNTIDRALGWNDGEPYCGHESVSRRLIEPLMAWLSDVEQVETLTSLIRMGQDFHGNYGRTALFGALGKFLAFRAYDDAHDLAYDLFRATGSEIEDAIEPLIKFLLESDQAKTARQAAIDAGEFGDVTSVLLHGTESPYRLAAWSDYNGDADRFSLWVPDSGALENLESLVGSSEQDPTFDRVSAMRAAAEKYCSGVINDYNSWAEGDVHNASIFVIDRTTGQVTEEDCGGGYIGSDYAEKDLEERMSRFVEEHLH